MSQLSVARFLPGLLLPLLWLSACGASAITQARVAIHNVSVGVAAADEHAADGYAEAAKQNLTVSSDYEQYRFRMREWDQVELSLRLARASLMSAQAVVDIADDGGQVDWLSEAACLAGSLYRLVSELEDVGIEIPTALSSGAEALLRLSAGLDCSGGATDER